MWKWIKINFDNSDPLETLGMSPEEITAATGEPGPVPNDGDALDTLWTEPKVETPSDEIPAEPAVIPEGTPEPIPAEWTPAPEGTPETTATPAEETPAAADEVIAESKWKSDEDAIKILEDALWLNETAIKTETEAIKAEAENSSMSEEEKTAFNTRISDLESKNMEKDEIIKELQTRYTAQETKTTSLVTDNENLKMDSTINRQLIDKYEADPKLQEFFALKTKSDSGNEWAKVKLEEFYKSALSDMWYDIDKLIQQKKISEKKAMSNQEPIGSVEPNTNFNEWDALENL